MIYRQGEILIAKVSKSSRPNFTLKEIRAMTLVPDNVIREGEISGHKHEVKNGILRQDGPRMILEAKQGCQIIHPEHKPLNLPQGTYTIEIQREYDETKDSAKVKD